MAVDACDPSTQEALERIKHSRPPCVLEQVGDGLGIYRYSLSPQNRLKNKKNSYQAFSIHPGLCEPSFKGLRCQELGPTIGMIKGGGSCRRQDLVGGH